MGNKMDKKLYISIAGQTASGKSTVAMIIKECLREYGFEVEFDGGVDFEDEKEFNEFLAKNQEQRIEALTELEERTVVLSEIQLQKDVVKVTPSKENT